MPPVLYRQKLINGGVFFCRSKKTAMRIKKKKKPYKAMRSLKKKKASIIIYKNSDPALPALL